jgi:citrate synthase
MNGHNSEICHSLTHSLDGTQQLHVSATLTNKKRTLHQALIELFQTASKYTMPLQHLCTTVVLCVAALSN